MDITGYALITGAGSGIGRACALAFAREGAAGVAFTDLNFEAAQQAAEESRALATHPTYQAVVMPLDVTSETQVEAVVTKTQQSFGTIDYLVNSAGIGVQVAAEIAEASLTEFIRFLDVNVTGSFLLTKYVSRTMKEQEARLVSARNAQRGCTRGVILNMASCASFVATPALTQYTTSKHAVLGLTRNAALDNAKYGIRVNCLCPSWVDTPMVDRAVKDNPDLVALIAQSVPMGRIAQVDEITDLILFLCSPRASYRLITGHSEEDGKGHFLVTDRGDHHRIMGENQAVANILYSTQENPVDLNDSKGIQYARENEPGLHIPNGTVARMIDFGPGVESPMHRALSIDYGIVLEGEFELTLDSGETRIMKRGDVSVQRATSHKWKNITGGETEPGRMLYILLDCKEVRVQGKPLEGFLGELEKEYEGRSV
ncbi:NAD(P)-binding protein [Aspergillus fijiensis CBS 313.89]|uniref:NAD(P)-binding protein n=1 Tax=Aspergillus fijiensis CBS 313.89 TaxID=1448319 RepID=A0A8G1VU31_9EURO|nr:NAD(P)-binding protein [Aspergillus fijiensis CBS 313.89]RAK71701.1 NAD(P)-binding protein [Aspergillus fijiensis CBS 313.89]